MASVDGYRYIPLPASRPHDTEGWKVVYAEIQAALIKSVRQIEREAGRTREIDSTDSVYVGITGIAFMQYRLAELCSDSALQAKLTHEGRSLLLNPDALRGQADRHLLAIVRRNQGFLAPRNPSHSSFLLTSIGQATLLLSRCLESLSRPQYSENENLLANLRRYWTAAAQVIANAVEKIPRDDSTHVSLDDANGIVEMDEDGCEVLYGRAGLLYSLLYLRKALGKVKDSRGYTKETGDAQRQAVEAITSDRCIGIVVDSIVARGRLGAKAYVEEIVSKAKKADGSRTPPVSPALMWKWHGKRYLGGAHGVAGILQMLVSCPTHIVERNAVEILDTVRWLISIQEPSGNWPSKAPDRRILHKAAGPAESSELVQWCHGAPGVVILLSTLVRVGDHEGAFAISPQERAGILESIDRGAQIIYEQGLLRKGLGLCHGVGGSVYALLAASKVLDSLPLGHSKDGQTTFSDSAAAPSSPSRCLKMAIHLAHLGTFADDLVERRMMRTPDHPSSLYEGVAGMCCGWMEILHGLSRGVGLTCEEAGVHGMPGYGDL